MRLLSQPAFRNLWAASSISSLGTTLGALSLTALIYLDASAKELGVLAAASSAPALVLSLPAGVIVDRVPRVPLMRAADVARFGALIAVPLLALAGELAMPHLYAVAAVVGAFNVLFEVAFRSALPGVVPKEDLVDANGTLAASDAVAGTSGPALGGGIAQALGAPVAALVDAITFLLSAMFLGGVPAAAARERGARERADAGAALDGLRFVAREPRLRAILGMVVSYSFFSGFILALYGLWIIDGLELSAFTLGLLLASGGVGSVAGSALASPVARRVGIGRGIVLIYVAAAALSFMTPLAAGPIWLVLAMLTIEQCAGDTLWATHNIQAVSLRQSLTPDEQLGRVNALFLIARYGLRPLGAVVAGFVAASAGTKAALLVSCAGINVAGLWLVASPLWASGGVRGEE